MKKTQIVKQFKSVPLKTTKKQETPGLVWVAVGALTAAVATYTAYKVFKPKALSLPAPMELEKNEIQYPEAEAFDTVKEEGVAESDLLNWIKEDLKNLSQFADWANENLPKIDDTRWYVALGEGKWSLHEVLAHLYYWDKYTIEEMLPLMTQDANLKFIEIQSLNDKAWAFAKTFERDLLLELFVATRKRLVQLIEEMDNKEFTYILGSGEATLHSYLKIFVHHDSEHQPQFEKAMTNIDLTE